MHWHGWRASKNRLWLSTLRKICHMFIRINFSRKLRYNHFVSYAYLRYLNGIPYLRIWHVLDEKRDYEVFYIFQWTKLRSLYQITLRATKSYEYA